MSVQWSPRDGFRFGDSSVSISKALGVCVGIILFDFVLGMLVWLAFCFGGNH